MPLRRGGWRLSAALIAVACSSATSPAPAAPTRSYYMGFSAFPPRFDSASYTNSLAMSLPHADAGIIHSSMPWAQLLAGVAPESTVLQPNRSIVSIYRSHGMALVVTLDPTNGLDRTSEDAALVAAGRSITEPAIQDLYRRYALALDTLFHPDYLGLAAETNLNRIGLPAPVYAALVTMTNAAAAAIHAVDASRPLYVSAQVETAWGRLNNSPYIGIEQDFTDFPFIQALGLSSYPYLGGYAEPSALPDDYYTRLRAGRNIPMLVVEGGWASTSVGSVVTDPLKQSRYIARHRTLLDGAHAVAVFQLDFADFDTTGLHLPPTSTLPLFTSIGLVDVDLHPKPALAAWDSTFARPRVP